MKLQINIVVTLSVLFLFSSLSYSKNIDYSFDGSYIYKIDSSSYMMIDPSQIRISKNRVYYTDFWKVNLIDKEKNIAKGFELTSREIIDCQTMMYYNSYSDILYNGGKRVTSDNKEEWNPIPTYLQDALAIPACNGDMEELKHSLLKRQLEVLNEVDISTKEKRTDFAEKIADIIIDRKKDELEEVVQLMISFEKLKRTAGFESINLITLADSFGRNPMKFIADDGTYHRNSAYETDDKNFIAKYSDGTNTLIYFDGAVNSETVEIVKNIIKNEPIDFIYFNSPGGSLNSGLELGRILKKNQVSSIVQEGDFCGSACAIAFVGGSIRSIYEPDSLVFHSPYYTFEGEKISLSNDSKIADEICSYLEESINVTSGKALCGEMISTSKSVTYSFSELKKRGYITSRQDGYINEFTSKITPYESATAENKWYYQCVVAQNYLDKYGYDKEVDQFYEDSCYYKTLPENHKWINLKYSEVVSLHDFL